MDLRYGRDTLLSMMLLWSLEFSKQVKTHVCFKSPYPVRNPEAGFLTGYGDYPVRNPEAGFFMSGSWEWVIFGAQGKSCLDAFSDTTNDLVTCDSKNPRIMSSRRYSLSHGCSLTLEDGTQSL